MTRSCSASPKTTPTLSIEERKAHAETVMRFVDRLKPEMRACVHDYGVEIVQGMIIDGHRDAGKLRKEIDSGFERRQQRALDQIPY